MAAATRTIPIAAAERASGGIAEMLGTNVSKPRNIEMITNRQERWTLVGTWRDAGLGSVTTVRGGAKRTSFNGWPLTFDLSGGAKRAKRPLRRPLDGGVRRLASTPPHTCQGRRV